MRTRTATAVLTAGLLLAGCSSSDSSDAKPNKTVTATTTASAPLTKEETIEQCTDAVAEAAAGWDQWGVDPGGWEDDPDTPEVCKTLDTVEYMDAFTEGLNQAVANGVPEPQ